MEEKRPRHVGSGESCECHTVLMEEEGRVRGERRWTDEEIRHDVGDASGIVNADD